MLVATSDHGEWIEDKGFNFHGHGAQCGIWNECFQVLL